jgi:hypothetical protein
MVRIDRRGRALGFSAVLVLAWAAGSCNKPDHRSRKADKASSEAPAKGPTKTERVSGDTTTEVVPGKCGNYPVDVKLPPRGPCKIDADCAWTAHRPGTCVVVRCTGHYVAGNRAWVAAANELHRRICTGRRFRACERYRCRRSKPKGVVCNKGRCELLPGDG